MLTGYVNWVCKARCVYDDWVVVVFLFFTFLTLDKFKRYLRKGNSSEVFTRWNKNNKPIQKKLERFSRFFDIRTDFLRKFSLKFKYRFKLYKMGVYIETRINYVCFKLYVFEMRLNYLNYLI
jgi:hypothetical protein